MWVDAAHQDRYRTLLNQKSDMVMDWKAAIYIISSNQRIYNAFLPAMDLTEGTVAVGNIGPLNESDSYLLTAGLSLFMELYPIRLKDLRVLDTVSYQVLEKAMQMYYSSASTPSSDG